MPRTLAIGDIHGNLDQFDTLLQAVALKPDDHLILLGDLIDRGPDSAGVLKRIMKLRQSHRLTIIMGNHEEMMLAARTGHIDHLREWYLNGGDTTLFSYGGRHATMRDIPQNHWRFLETGLVDYLETDTHIFVHASCLPDHDLVNQPDYVLRWERCDDIRPHRSGKVIVCGHTPQHDGHPMNKGYAICLDTGAGFGRPLTCLECSTGKLWQAELSGDIIRGIISDFGEETEELSD